ncbi:SCP2 sterol-binding domain-containing protein [Roseovarius indicus]|uniref:SCP2 sterol-binding domain-containing protein n=2 Tax=Roseovarius indicus TaxID=540747 RepID=UPI0032F08E80
MTHRHTLLSRALWHGIPDIQPETPPMTPLEDFAAAVSARAKGRIRGSVALNMPDLGRLYVDETGATESDRDADLTLTATSQVFRNIVEGSQNPTTAVMTGKLKVDGSPMRALKVGEILSAAP